MSARTLVLFAALLGTLLALPAQAQWKWRGKDGQIQYSDLAPPAGTPDASILQRPTDTPGRVAAAAPAASAASGSASSSGLAPKAVEPELEAKRRKAEQEKADKAKADAEKNAAGRADSCARAKSYLQTLDSGVRITRSNDKGEREFIDDKTRADETQRTRGIVASDCK